MPEGRRLLAYLLLALGFLWLALSLGVLSASLLVTLARLWPVLLIGIGMDILVQRRFLKLPYTALVFIGLLGYGLLAPPQMTLTEQTFREPPGRAERLELDLHLSSAPAALQASAGGSLVEATVRDAGRVRFSAKGNRTKRVRLEKVLGRGVRWDEGVDRHWNIGVNRDIPLDLNVEGGSGRANLDLSTLHLRRLGLELHSGATTLSLPTPNEPFEAEIAGGSGRLSVNVTADAQLELEADLGSGGAIFVFEEGSGYADVSVESGSGSVTFDVPEGGNVRLEVQDDASGALFLPNWLERLEGDAEEGVWQTQGFNPGLGQILITLEDRGSGAITVK